jgi:hypothetical protein
LNGLLNGELSFQQGSSDNHAANSGPAQGCYILNSANAAR